MNWINTTHGRLDLLAPSTADIHLDDIALSLSRQVRHLGFTRAVYTVAQHSIHVSMLLAHLPPAAQLHGLMHDAHEAFLGEIATPVKHCIGDALSALESSLQSAVFQRFDIDPAPWYAEVHHADLVALATEVRDLRSGRHDWPQLDGIEPHPDTLTPWSERAAHEAFIRRFWELSNQSITALQTL